MKPQPIIFTDLDGTLLDARTYTFTAALPALERVRQEKIPLVFCSSKTRAEMEHWRKQLANSDPFIAQNGGGIFIPVSYFSTADIETVWPGAKKVDGYHTLVLGTPYPVLRAALEDARVQGFDVRGFGDMTPAEVAELTGLGPREAELAKERDFDEPFLFRGDHASLEGLLTLIREKGLRCAEGRVFHVMGENDKGKAVEILKELYKRQYGKIVTIALGDTPIDFPMLEKVDYPVLVRNAEGQHDPRITLPSLIKADGIGPKGWNDTIPKLLHQLL
jgi:mannosyl-3-phosphoglycerate phosphatase